MMIWTWCWKIMRPFISTINHVYESLTPKKIRTDDFVSGHCLIDRNGRGGVEF